ncbi:MAG: 2Fe-2S iron-sulfur cluster binding domain-containing protein [Pyrinomonadaceae bacterium]|nr:2Fe-2S iron-sulfur cluster binding domain-containing protein [Pyrinomonadaceae bacterium]
MLKFILNNQTIETDLPVGMTLLDFVRYQKNLKGTKIGCREGDCGACTILIGELKGDGVEYRSMTSCLTPLANANGKHVVTVEGINPQDGGLTPVQKALVDESGTQCGFCTVGFVMSMTGFCIDKTQKTNEMAVSAVDGNICRCTGYKSIERACERFAESREPLAVSGERLGGVLERAIERHIVPEYFSDIENRLERLANKDSERKTPNSKLPIVGGGTDLYVQRHDEMAGEEANHVFYDDELRQIVEEGEYIEIGASVTVTDLLESPLIQEVFPDLYKHLKLVSSTPIRNMATLAGNFVNASPIGDMTVWFLALDADILVSTVSGSDRFLSLKDLYLGYKDLAKSKDETINTIRFKKPISGFHFNFEKVCKRTYLDIATVNTAISLRIGSFQDGSEEAVPHGRATDTIFEAHVAAGGVAPIPLYLRETSAYLKGKEISEETISNASAIMQDEISPISDVRGSKKYKRLLLRQLFKAHFAELFGI